MKPTAEQQRAIAARDREVLLEAGAGTGKTTVLVGRYCEALIADGAGVEEVLAFTFTERAAAQLRDRIRRELRARGEQELARESEGARISTIHGFCNRLVSSHPVALGIDPRFRVLDAPEADRVAAGAFDEALERFLAAGGRERTELVAAFRVAPLRDLIRGAHDELRSRGQQRPVLPAAPEPPSPASVEKRIEALKQGALAEEAEATGASAEKRRIKIEAGDTFSHAKAGPAVEDYLDRIEDLQKHLVESEALPLYASLAELLQGFCETFGAAKAERSGLDFEDLQLEAVRLLKEREAIRDSYRERFKHVMVDEFQDTNRLQLELIEQLCGSGTSRFAVGDEFQSIYGFRHADLEVFRAERLRVDRLEDGRGELLQLSGNFRSLPAVIDGVNELGAALLEGFKPLTAARDDDAAPGAAAELLLTPSDGWKAEEGEEDPFNLVVSGEDASPPNRRAEARFLAARLRRLVDEENVERGDIVVLLRAFTHVGAYEEELDRAGLRPYLVGGRGYWSDQQVTDARALLATIANPLDDPSLLGALSSPAAGVSPDALWLLRRAAGSQHLWGSVERQFGGAGGEPKEGEAEWADKVPPDDRARLEEFCARHAALREVAPVLSLEELVERAIRDTGYDLAVISMTRGRHRFANLRKLMRLARGYEAAEGRDLRGFLEFLDERQATAGREGEAAIESEEHDGVRVMTVHNAKGLEFPVVAVADLGREATAGGRTPWLLIDRDANRARVGLQLARLGRKAPRLFDYRELADEAAEQEAAESCRLAYVAATRARDRLLLSGIFRAGKIDAEQKPSTPLVERLLAALGETEPADGATGPFELLLNEPDPERFKLLAPAGGDGQKGQEVPVAPVPVAAQAAPEPAARRLSYSTISTYEDCGYRFYAERVIGLPREGERPGAGGWQGRSGLAFGNAVHVALEWCGRHGWREPDRTELREILIRERAGDLDRAETMIRGWLSSALCDEIRKAASTQVEVPFAFKLGDSMITGKIDLLAELADGTRLVLDYKTDKGGPPEDIGRYKSQRLIYALAAGGADRPVRTAYVFLNSPDRPVVADLSAEELAEGREDLEQTLARIDAGEFEPTEEPGDWLCQGCPAQARLCPRWTWNEGSLQLAGT